MSTVQQLHVLRTVRTLVLLLFKTTRHSAGAFSGRPAIIYRVQFAECRVQIVVAAFFYSSSRRRPGSTASVTSDAPQGINNKKRTQRVHAEILTPNRITYRNRAWAKEPEPI